MRKRSISFLICSVIMMIIMCIGVMVFFSVSMAGNSNEAINELGIIYMENMNDEITMHFQTTIELRLNQADNIVKRNPAENFQSEDDILKALSKEGRMHNFNSLAFLSSDGDIQMIYGDDIQMLDLGPFLKSLNNDEKKVAVAVNSLGENVIMLGISSIYPMENGKECTALIAGIPIDDVEEILSFDKQNTITYSSIVRKNGDFVVKNYREDSNNYFGRIRNLIDGGDAGEAETYIAEIQAAMEENRAYSTSLPFSTGRRHLYCSPLSHSEWYILTSMPYGEIDGLISSLDSKRLTLLGFCILNILAMYVIMFVLYYRMTSRQMTELDKARREADRANQAKSEFLSNLSHDIRTPMNAISAMTLLASANIDNKLMTQDYLKKISLSNKHLLKLINDILDMSKIEGGKMELNMETMSLRDVVEDIVTIIQSQIKMKRQYFEVLVYDIETENVRSDSVRLNQLLLNLVSNAIKFTPEEGRICFSIYQSPSARGLDYVQVHIIIQDNGMGMTEAFKEQIFKPFTREDNKRVQKTEGTGLGMAISKHIVDAMHGTIDVESELNKGTTFHVMIDMEKPLEEQEELSLPNKRVLVVDENELLCSTTAGFLRELGMEAEWVIDGEKAVAKVKEQHEGGNDYQIVLIDCYLPGINGIEASKEIDRISGGKTMIIMASAYDLSERAEEAYAAGVKGFISKPLFKSSLYEGLKRIIEGTSAVNASFESKKDFTGMRLLVAEDNDLNWEIASELLAHLGFVSEHAENGEVCVKKFEQSEIGYYAAILMDIRMPVMTGYEAAIAIRKLERADANLPIIAMTADAFTEDIKRCLDCGMNAHVSKPIELTKLVNQLEKYIQ